MQLRLAAPHLSGSPAAAGHQSGRWPGSPAGRRLRVFLRRQRAVWLRPVKVSGSRVAPPCAGRAGGRKGGLPRSPGTFRAACEGSPRGGGGEWGEFSLAGRAERGAALSCCFPAGSSPPVPACPAPFQGLRAWETPSLVTSSWLFSEPRESPAAGMARSAGGSSRPRAASSAPLGSGRWAECGRKGCPKAGGEVPLVERFGCWASRLPFPPV